MRRIIGILLLGCLMVIPGVVYASSAGVPDDEAMTQVSVPVYQNAQPVQAERRVTVQRVANRGISAADQCEIENLIKRDKVCGENACFMREKMPVAIATGMIDARDKNGVIILNQSATHYITMLQTYLAVMNGTDWYVRVPACPPATCLPAFTPGQSCGGLVAPTLPTDFCQPAPVCLTASQPASTVRFGQEGSYRESQLGVFGGFSDKSNDHRRPCPPEPTCDPVGPGPGGGPPAPPPPCDVP